MTQGISPTTVAASALAQSGATASARAVTRSRPPDGARRMPPVNRSQRTEYLGVPVWHAPLGATHADWPIIATYTRLVWRGDDFSVADEQHEDGDER